MVRYSYGVSRDEQTCCRYEAACKNQYSIKIAGESAAQAKDPERRLMHLTRVCGSLHKVYAYAAEKEQRMKTLSACPFNPRSLSCTCKGFRHHSICSHIISAGLLLGDIAVDRRLKVIRNPTSAHRRKAARSGAHMQPESSDEGEGENEGDD